jgi:cysteine-rich repeat protein
MAQFLTSQPRGICGDGTVSPDEQCEIDHDCSHENRCIKCLCVTTVCGLALCGNGQVDPGEACDDGNTNDNDPCQSCKVAVCGDGVVCSDPSCAGTRGARPEQCDPPGPDTVHCPNVCLPDCTCDIIG